jgi:hypothetical protein
MTAGPQDPYGAPQQPPYQPYQPYQQQQPPPYGYGQPYRPPAPKHPSSTTAMVLGLIAVVGIFSCGGVTLVLAPFAWVMGGRAVKEIDAAPPGTYSGRDEATIGRITGIVGTVLLILGVLAAIAFIAFFVAAAGAASY